MGEKERNDQMNAISMAGSLYEGLEGAKEKKGILLNFMTVLQEWLVPGISILC